MDLTPFALKGYDNPEGHEPYMLGSDAYMAWRTGQWLRARGAPRPEKVVSGPGYRVIVDGVRVFEVWEDSEPQDVTG